MTTEERRKLLKQLATQPANEEKASVGALKTEALEEPQLYKVNPNDMVTRRELLKQLATNGGESNFSKGTSLAEQQWEALNNVKDRKVLTSYYNAYMQDLQNTINNKDEVNYERDRLLLNRIAEKLGKQANIGTFMQDTSNEIGGNIRLNIADTARNAEKAYLDFSPGANLNADVLYKIAKKDSGTLKETIDSNKWGKDEWRELVLLKEKYPNDEIINHVYDTVAKQGYKGDKQYFEDTIAYINNLNKTDRYKASTIVRNTQDEKNYMQNQKLQEELTYQEPFDEPNINEAAKFALSGVGTASYMVPAIATAVATGNAAGLGAGKLGYTAATAKSIAETASQAGSLFEMYNAAAGSAFDQTLNAGYDWDTAVLYSRLSGTLEVVTEMIGGENVNAALFNHTLGKTALSPATSRLIEKGSSDIAKFMIAMATDVAGEAVEEIISAALEPVIDYLVLNKETSLEEVWSSILESAAGSVIPTLILGGFGKVQTINAVNKTEKELLNMVNDYRAQASNEIFTAEELDTIEETIKTWSNRAKAGISEHYDELEKQTKSYENVMNEIYGNLQTRPFASLNIVEYAQSVQDMEPQAREQAIINYAKEQGIDEARLRQMFGGYQEMFPYSYQQASETIKRWAQTPTAENQVQNNENGIIANNVIKNNLGANENAPEEQENNETIRPPEDFNGNEYEWLEQYFGKETNKGIERLAVRNEINSIKNGDIFGVYDGNNIPSDSKLAKSPVMLAVYSINPEFNNHNVELGYFFYKNLNDALKDIDNRYDGVDGISDATDGDYELVSVEGEGKFEYSLRDKAWINMNQNTSQQQGETQPKQKQLRTIKPPSKLNKGTFKKNKGGSQGNATASSGLASLANKYGTLRADNFGGKKISYVEINKFGAKSPFVDYFRYYNPESDGKTFKDKTQEKLNSEPIVAIFADHRADYTGYIFENFDDFKAFYDNPSTFRIFAIARNASSEGNFTLDKENGDWVWRSDLTGKKVKFENPPSSQISPIGTFVSAFKKALDVVRHIDFRGETFSNAEELANIMQRAIDATGETDRFIFTKKIGKKQEIIGQETITANLPATTQEANDRYIMLDYLANKAKALNADFIYGMHNHPGHSTPSGSKSGQTKDYGAAAIFRDGLESRFKKAGIKTKFGGELVEGLNDYSFFYGRGRKGFGEVVDAKYGNGYKYDGIKDEAWTKKSINTVYDLDYFMKNLSPLSPQKGYTRIVLIDADLHARAVINVKDSALKGRDEINRLLLDIAMDYGALYAAADTDSTAVFNELKDASVKVKIGKDNTSGATFKKKKERSVYIGYGLGRGERAYYLTPADEQINNDQYIGRDAKPEENKKEPRHRLEKKQPSLADKVNEEYKRLTSKTTKENETQDRYELIPTDLELKNTDIEQTIRKIESGEMEAEVDRARRSLADMRRYINKTIMKGRMGILKGPLSRKAYGVWKANSHWIRNTQMSNVSTWFHELGHEINSTALNMEALNKAMSANPNIRTELNTLCEIAFGDKYNKKPNVKLSEGFAEGIRRFIENPEKFSRDFTNVANMFINEAETNKNFADTMAKLKVLSEMVKDYENQPGDERLISNVDLYGEGDEPVYVENPLQRLGTWITEQIFNDMVYAAKVDRMRAKSKGIKYAKLLSTEKFEDNLRIRGNAQNIITQLSRGVYDDNGNKITNGLAEIMEEFLPNAEEARQMGMSIKQARRERIRDLIKYGIAIREKTLIDTRSEDLMLGTRENDIIYTLKKYSNDAKIQHAMKQINDNSKAFIKLAVDKGLIKASTGEQILNDNIMYFPLNRVVEDRLTTTLGRSRDGSTGKSFYQLRGSDLQISNPLVSLMSNWGRILYHVEHNELLKMLVNFAKDTDDMGYFLDTGVAPKMSFRGQASMSSFKEAFRSELESSAKHIGIDIPVDDIIDDMDFDEVYNLFIPEAGDASQRMMSYIENGVRKTIQFANNDLGNGLFKLLANLDAQKSGLFLNILNAINTPLKLTATAWNVEFALSNMQSDALQRFLYSNGTAFYIPIITSMYNVARYMNSRYSGSLPWKPEKAGEMYEKFLRSGASQEGTFRGDQLWQRDHMKEVFGYAEDVLFGKKKITSFDDFRKKLKLTGDNISEKLNYFSEISEQSTRFAEFVMVYNQMKAKGFDEQTSIREAGIKARQVTQDFTVQGKLTRQVNKVVPFASATIGGLYRFGQEARNHPVRLTARLSVLAALAMFIETMMDGEDREYYEEINKQKRFDNFFFKNPDDPQHPIIIKKPQGPARYVINLAQLITNMSLGRIPEDKVEEEFYDWLARSVNDQLPVTSPTDLTPSLLQAMIENMINKDFYYGTPIVSKDLEKLDPRHQYDEYTSEVAKAIGNVFNWSPAKIDNIITTWFSGVGKQFNNFIDRLVRTDDENKAPSKDVSEKLMTSKIFANAFRSSESINEVYDRLEYLEREEAEGRITEKENREYENLKIAKNALSQMNKQMKEARENPKLTSEQKAKKLNLLREQRIDVARYYLGKSALNQSNVRMIELLGYFPANDTYVYTLNKKKYNVKFDDRLKKEYAEEFQREYEKELKKLKETAAYKKSTEAEKLELERKTKTTVRSSMTNKYKKIAYERQYKN